MSIEAPEGRQQRGVNIEVAVTPALDEARRVQPHEPGIAEDFDAGLLEGLVERGIEGIAGRKRLVIDGEGGDGGGFGAGEAFSARHVRDHDHDLGGVVRCLAGVDQGLKVGAATRDENADALSRHPASLARLPA